MIAPRASTAPKGPTAFANPQPDDWLTYHRDTSRSGYDSAFPQFASVSLHWKSSSLDGSIYAEPLIVGTAAIVSTESNTLYELNATTGQTVWHTNLGTPVNGGTLPCGDINPSGITGTPVIDVAGRTIFVVAFLQATDGTLSHHLFAVNLDTGSIRFQLPIDPNGATARIQQQRAALALSNGYVYVAYGGLDGDCGQYHGWLAATQTNGAGPVISYQVPTGRAGAIWGGGDGPAVDSSGDLLVATGNSDATSTFDFGDSVMKLSSASTGQISVLDWFAPLNWAQLNEQDLDLGSTEPAILNSTTLFQIGKEGVGYLLNANNLSGGKLYSSQVCASGHGAYGGLAYAYPYLVVPCDNGLVTLRVNLGFMPSFTVVWRGPNYLAGPPIIAGNTVWDVDVSGGMIYALDLTSGQTRFHDIIGSLPTHFNSLSASDGQIFVTANRQLLAYVTQTTQLVVTPQAPANNTALNNGYTTLQLKVTDASAAAVAGANVTIYVNSTAICTNAISSTIGLASCPFEITSAGTYYWNGTAQQNGFDSAVPPQTTFALTAGPVVQMIPLTQGWNLISTAIVPVRTDLGSVLASLIASADLTAIWSYQNGQWTFAVLSNGIMSGSLKTMQDGFGYWIYMTRADNLFVIGSVLPPLATPPTYSLNAGWNLLGYKPQPKVQSQTVAIYLSSIMGSYDTNNVWVYNNTAQTWIRASSSYALQPGQSLWVLMTTSAILKP